MMLGFIDGTSSQIARKGRVTEVFFQCGPGLQGAAIPRFQTIEELNRLEAWYRSSLEPRAALEKDFRDSTLSGNLRGGTVDESQHHPNRSPRTDSTDALRRP